MYYTSTTKSFLSLINSRYVIYACNYYNTDEDDRDNYVSNLIDEVSSHHEVKKILQEIVVLLVL